MSDAPKALLAILVCPDIEVTRAFYESLGLTFVLERHNGGVEHYAAKIGDAVLELYPASNSKGPAFIVGFDAAERRMRDPDGRPVLR